MACLGLKFFLEGLVRMADLSSDIYYVMHEKFAMKELYYACLGSLASLPVIVTLMMIFMSITLIKSLNDCMSQLLFSIFIIILHPIGFASIGISIYLCFIVKNDDTEKQHEIKYLSKICKIAECLLESLPQAAIQGYNNYLNGDWTTIAKISMGFSALSLLTTIFSYLRIIDKEINLEGRRAQAAAFTIVQEFPDQDSSSIFEHQK